MRDGISAKLGLKPLPEETLLELQEEYKKQIAGVKNVWSGNAGFGRQKGSKNRNPYPCSEAVLKRRERSKALTRKRSSGKLWVTDGKTSKFVSPDAIPEGFVKGRVMKNTRPEYKESLNGV